MGHCGKTIAVTGAMGFLGKALCAELWHSTQCPIVASTSQEEACSEWAAKHGADDRCTVMRPEQLNGWLAQGHEQVVLVNCAFPRNVEGEKVAVGMDYLFELVQAASVGQVKKFINVSSQSVYSQKRRSPASEDDMPCLESVYAVAKYAVELQVGAAFDRGSYTNIRLSSLIGPGFDQRVVNRFCDKFIANEEVVITGRDQVFDYLYVTDAVSALASVVFAERDLKPVYNLGAGNPRTLLQLAELTLESLVRLDESFSNREILLGEGGSVELLAKFRAVLR